MMSASRRTSCWGVTRCGKGHESGLDNGNLGHCRRCRYGHYLDSRYRSEVDFAELVSVCACRASRGRKLRSTSRQMQLAGLDRKRCASGGRVSNRGRRSCSRKHRRTL